MDSGHTSVSAGLGQEYGTNLSVSASTDKDEKPSMTLNFGCDMKGQGKNGTGTNCGGGEANRLGLGGSLTFREGGGMDAGFDFLGNQFANASFDPESGEWGNPQFNNNWGNEVMTMGHQDMADEQYKVMKLLDTIKERNPENAKEIERMLQANENSKFYDPVEMIPELVKSFDKPDRKDFFVKQMNSEDGQNAEKAARETVEKIKAAGDIQLADKIAAQLDEARKKTETEGVPYKPGNIIDEALKKSPEAAEKLAKPDKTVNSEEGILDRFSSGIAALLGTLGISAVSLGILNRTGAGSSSASVPGSGSGAQGAEAEVAINRRREEGDGAGGEAGGDGPNDGNREKPDGGGIDENSDSELPSFSEHILNFTGMTENTLQEGLLTAEETGQFRDPETGTLIMMENDKIFVYRDGEVFEADRTSGTAELRPVDGTADAERLNSANSDAESEEILTQKTGKQQLRSREAKKFKEQLKNDLSKRMENHNEYAEKIQKKNMDMFRDKLAKGEFFETQNPSKSQEMYKFMMLEVYGGGKDWNAQMQGGNAGFDNGKGFKDAMTDRFRALYGKLKVANSAYLENGVLTERGKNEIEKDLNIDRKMIDEQFNNNLLLNQTGVGSYWGSVIINTIAEGLSNLGSSIINANNAKQYADIRKKKLDYEIGILIKQNKTPEDFIKNFQLQETITDFIRKPLESELTRRAEKLPLEGFEIQYIYEKYILELRKKVMQDMQNQDIPKGWKQVNS